jgi:nitrous oxidase accessory protein NosD
VVKAFLLLIFLGLLPTAAQALSLSSDTVWRGALEFSETVRVERGVTLRVEPGTEIHFSGGGLEVLGHLEAHGALFSGGDWEGIQLHGGEHLLDDCRISGARIGLLVLGGAPRLMNLEVSGNGTGIELRRQTSAEVRGCRILDNHGVGLFLKDEARPRIQDCLIQETAASASMSIALIPRCFATICCAPIPWV